jgi:hypothetical protein
MIDISMNIYRKNSESTSEFLNNIEIINKAEKREENKSIFEHNNKNEKIEEEKNTIKKIKK